MIETKAFLTDDGRLFRTEKEALDYEVDRDKSILLTELVQRIYYRGICEDELRDKLQEAVNLGLIAIHIDRREFLRQL
jgi:hypothetical protein